jgi:hypothetical protein
MWTSWQPCCMGSAAYALLKTVRCFAALAGNRPLGPRGGIEPAATRKKPSLNSKPINYCTAGRLGGLLSGEVGNSGVGADRPVRGKDSVGLHFARPDLCRRTRRGSRRTLGRDIASVRWRLAPRLADFTTAREVA